MIFTHKEFELLKKVTFEFNEIHKLSKDEQIDKLFIMYLGVINTLSILHKETGYVVENGHAAFRPFMEPNIEYII